MSVIERIEARPLAMLDATPLDELQKAVTYLVMNRLDLTQRQLGTLLLIGCTEGPHTIRGLAAALKIQRPVATRAVDVLEVEGLAIRLPDPADRRSVHVVATAKARSFLRNLAASMGPSGTLVGG